MKNVTDAKLAWVDMMCFPRPAYNSSATIKAPSSQTLGETKEKRLIEALYLAVDMVAYARETLAHYGPSSPQRVRSILEVLFSSDFLDKNLPTFNNLKDTLEAIEDGLKSNITIKVAFPPQSNNKQGYVHARSLKGWRAQGYTIKETDIILDVDGQRMALGNIHLSHSTLNTSCRIHETAKTIIHEASHRYCATRDHEYIAPYFNVMQFQAMAPDRAVRNADTIARFCQYLTVPNLEKRHPVSALNKPRGLNFLGPC